MFKHLTALVCTFTVLSCSVPVAEPDGGMNVDMEVMQTIQTTATSPLTVTEGQFIEFDVWLGVRPTAPVQVNVRVVPPGLVTVSPETLIFDGIGSNFSTHQTVRVTAVPDVDLVGGATTVRLGAASAPNVDLVANVTDDDEQLIVVSPSPLTVAEGGTATLDVHLMFEPSGTVLVTAGSASSELALSGFPLSFDASNYLLDQQVTVTALADSDAVDDSALLTFTGVANPTTVRVTTTDTTLVENLGYPAQFTNAQNVNNGSVLAYRITVPITASLDKMGLIAATGGGDYKLALYRDLGNQPADLVFAIDTRQALAAPGPREVDVLDQTLNAGSYWLAIRAAPQVSLGYSGSSPTGTICSRNLAASNLDTAWPSPFGASTCSPAGLLNVYIVTYRQP